MLRSIFIMISGILLLILAYPIKAVYVIPNFQTNWPSAVAHCKYIGKRLANTDSKQRLDAVIRKIEQSSVYNRGSTTNIWIAAANNHNGNGKPDTAGNIHHCPALLKAARNWQINYQNCNDKRFFVCED